MEKINSIADLQKLKQKSSVTTEMKGAVSHQSQVIIKVAMATCGIASGARETFDYFIQELKQQKINGIVSQTGCMSYCYAEPTVEITLPNEEPVVFGFVNTAKAQEIVDRYILQHELVDGVIPASYKTV